MKNLDAALRAQTGHIGPSGAMRASLKAVGVDPDQEVQVATVEKAKQPQPQPAPASEGDAAFGEWWNENYARISATWASHRSAWDEATRREREKWAEEKERIHGANLRLAAANKELRLQAEGYESRLMAIEACAKQWPYTDPKNSAAFDAVRALRAERDELARKLAQRPGVGWVIADIVARLEALEARGKESPHA